MMPHLYLNMNKKVVYVLLLLILTIPDCFANLYYDETERATLSIADSVSGQTFYVRTDGADAMTCTGLVNASAASAPDCAFLTIGFAAQTNSPRTNDPAAGDAIKIQDGTYHERFTPAVGGLTIGPNGSGEVIVDSSDQVTWAVHSGNVYVADWTSFNTYDVRALVIDDVNYYPVASGEDETDVTAGYFYYNTGTYQLYTSVITDLDDPDNHDVVVIRGYPTNWHTITVNTADTTIYGLTVRGSGGKGIAITGKTIGVPTGADNVVIENCDITVNGFSGVGCVYTNDPPENVAVTKNLIHNNMLHNWPRGRGGYSSGGWGKGADFLAAVTPSLTYNIVRDNGGEGIGIVRGTGGTVSDNIVYDNWSVGLYFNQQDTFTANGNFLYSGSVDLTDLTNNGWVVDVDAEYTSAARRLRQIGVSTGDEDAVAYTDGTIVNNVIVDCSIGITHINNEAGSGVKNTLVYGNTIIMPNSDMYSPSTEFPHTNHYYGISYSDTGYNSGSIVKNNIISGVHANTRLVRWQWAAGDNDTGITWDYNTYYHTGTATPLYFKGAWYNFADWQTNSSQDANGTNTDPALGDSEWSSTKIAEIYTLTGVDVTDYVPTATTPDGTSLGESYNTDFDGDSRTSWTSGAFEYGGSSVSGGASKSTAGTACKSTAGSSIQVK